jgi:hypothetical protein
VNSRFSQIGNDGIDISGSRVSVKNVVMSGIGDKGISVGERSEITAKNISIGKAKIGIASKDGSQFSGEDIRISDSDVGLTSYQKKSEFEGSSISVSGIHFSNTINETLMEFGSSIEMDNIKVEKYTLRVFDRLYGAK